MSQPPNKQILFKRQYLVTVEGTHDLYSPPFPSGTKTQEESAILAACVDVATACAGWWQMRVEDARTTVECVDSHWHDRQQVIGDVLKERRHQIACGHTPEADAGHTLGELSQEAMATIAAADDLGERGAMFAAYFWPFDYRQTPKADTGRRWLLIKAKALLLAELERLPRPETATSPTVLLLQDRP